MTVREYIGARYVPIFADPIQWDSTLSYEPLTVVMNLGTSYVSRQSVPAGIAIDNETYWVRWADYNAQLEEYIRQVQTYNSRIQENADDIAAIEAALPITEFDRTNTVDARLDTIEAVLPITAFDGTDTVDARFDTIEANGWVTETRLASNAVTSGKIADGAVNTSDIADSAITNAKIADGAVNSAKIADGSITLGKMSEGNARNMWSYSAIYSGKNVVFFGDSYLAPNIDNSEQEFVAQQIAAKLNMTKFNYAYGGAGFGRPTNNIATQQSTCENQMTADEKRDTALVICMAGCNDLLNVDSQSITQDMIVTGIHNFITWANSTFVNARILVIPFNWGFSKLTSQLNRLITNCMNSLNSSLHGYGADILPYAWCWNLGIASRFRNEVHPNQAGYRVITNHILNELMGNDGEAFGVAADMHFTNSAISDTGQQIRYNVRNGKVHIFGYIRPTSSQSGVGSQITIGAANTLPAIVTPNNSFFILPLTGSNDGLNHGVLIFSNDGSAAVRFADVSANAVLLFNETYEAEVGVNWSDYN